jgi:adenine phosphoribosyltransferase
VTDGPAEGGAIGGCYPSAEGGDVSDLKSLIRTIPDYPRHGVMFRDVTTLLGDAEGFRAAVGGLVEPFRGERVDAVAGIEARGFILGGAVAATLGCGFVPIRKRGKLPWKTIGEEYTLEYGVDRIEIHEDAIRPGARVVIVDDLIATGGTADAAARLVRRSGGVVVGAAFVVALPNLGGMSRVREQGVDCHALVAFDGH